VGRSGACGSGRAGRGSGQELMFPLIPFAIGVVVGGGAGMFAGAKTSELLLLAGLVGTAFVVYKRSA